MATAAAAAPKAATNKQAQAQAAVPAWPFSVGVLGTENASDYDESKTMGASTVKFPDVRVEPDGWLRGVWVDVNAVCSGNSAAVAFTEDGVFAAIDTVLFRDTGGEQIFGPFGGYDWQNTNKFGGYQVQGDPRADLGFSAVTGTAANGGSFHYTLYLPLEIAAADSLGDVENRSENSIYRIELVLAPSTAVYSTPPTALPTVEVKTTQDSYTEPVAAMALSGRPVASAPPSPGTLQYWRQEDHLVPGASGSVLVTNGIGNGYRNVIFKLIRSSGTRANGESDWPDPVELTLGTARVRNLYKAVWRDKMGRAFRLTNTTADAALGKENGVFPLWFDQDVSLMPGDEARRRYLRTKPGNTLKLRGTFANAGTVYITSNYIVPRNNSFAQVVA